MAMELDFTIFELKPFKKVTDGRSQSLKVLEEASEACESGKAYDSCIGVVGDDDAAYYRRCMLDELADVLQTVINMCACFNVTSEELERACKDCIERNEERGRY